MMLTSDGPKVIEFNVRFGDPESQVVLPRLTTDLAELLLAAATGDKLDVTFSDDACVTIALTADGYPASPRTGDPITGLDVATAVNAVTIFHAGTTRDDQGILRTAGGRVLNVTATGIDLEVARTRAYEAASIINFKGMTYRRDIAAEAATSQRRTS
jgi:phosphoribosylamine--glycine ligase